MLIETVVTSAQIYRRGCLISRSGIVELPEGRSQLLLAGMTPTADRDSLRLAFPEGVSGTSIQILDAGELTADTASNPIREELEDSHDA